MSRYRFTQTYSSSITAGEKDAEIDCTDEFAALVNNDAPGTLVAIEPEPRALDAPPSDRMVHTATRKRSDRKPRQPVEVKRP